MLPYSELATVRLVSLGEICEIHRGLTYRDLGVDGPAGVPFLRAADITGRTTISEELRPQYRTTKIAEAEELLLRRNDIVIPNISKNFSPVLVGQYAGECYVHHTLTVLRPKTDAPPAHVLIEYLRSDRIQQLVTSRASRLNGDLRLSISELALLPVPVFAQSKPTEGDGVELLKQYVLTGSELKLAVAEARQLTPELLLHLKRHEQDLEAVPWDVFEHLIAEFFASWGSAEVRLVGRDPRMQADLMVVHSLEPAGVRLKYFVEVKRTRNRIGMDVVNQVYGAFALEQPSYGWTLAMIVSLAGFKNSHRFTREQLEARNLHLKGRDDVLGWLRNYHFGPNGLWLTAPRTNTSASALTGER